MSDRTYPHIDPRTDIDWSRDYIWVQNTMRIALIEGIPENRAGELAWQYADGTSARMTRKAIDKAFLAYDLDKLWKPRYAPFKAHYIGEASVIGEAGGSASVLGAGGAVLMDRQDKWQTVDADTYRQYYRVVSLPGTAYPVVPFEPREAA